MNIPWPEKGMGDADYIHAFQKVIMPIAMEFAPELVISASPIFWTVDDSEYSLLSQFQQVSMPQTEMIWANAM